MRQFINKTVVFSGLLAAFFGTNVLINIHRLFDPVILRTTTLIMGDSHLKTSVDPTLLPNASNVCSGAEPYAVTYYKLQKYLKDNPQIEEIILGFSYNNLGGGQDRRLNGRNAKSQFIRYYEILPIDLPKRVEVNESKFYHTYIRELAMYPNFFESKFLGGFEKHKPGLEKADLTATINKHFYPDGQFAGLSKYAELYLDSIINLTKTRKLELIVVSPPLHKSYIQQVPLEIKDYFGVVKSNIEAQDIRVLDFIDLPYPDSLFKDYDHLSYNGAREFTLDILVKKPADIRQQGN